MLQNSRMFSGFSVDDIAAAQNFYGNVLGLQVSAANGMLELRTPGDRNTLVYPKPNHVPAEYTVLNFPVPDIDATIDALAAKGVPMIRTRRCPRTTRASCAAAPPVPVPISPGSPIPPAMSCRYCRTDRTGHQGIPDLCKWEPVGK